MTVAAIDIGSNTIKLLVAGADAAGLPRAVAQHTLEVRISAGIGAEGSSRLREGSMHAGVEAIAELLEAARAHQPRVTRIVATSAVRDAVNRQAFASLLRERLGVELEVLSGPQEARLIARGIGTDPALAAFPAFSVIDLGGGSLECIRYRERVLEQAVSLQIGAVRMTERHVPDAEAPFPAAARERIHRAVLDALDASRFAFIAGAPLVAAGGAATVTRAILAAKAGRDILRFDPRMPAAALQELLDEVSPLTLRQREALEGLPRNRADIYPAALVILLACARTAGAAALIHSFHNLRWGLAAELLETTL